MTVMYRKKPKPTTTITPIKQLPTKLLIESTDGTKAVLTVERFVSYVVEAIKEGR